MIGRPGLVLFILLSVVGCSSEKDQGFTGRYVGTQQFGIGQVSSPIELQLSQRGSLLSGSVTPPFQSAAVAIANGQVSGQNFRFDTRVGEITYRYEGVLKNHTFSENEPPNILEGNFGPLGCINSSLGEPCPTDSNGTFTATRQ